MGRNRNIEVLRVVLMMLIVVHHCILHGPLKGNLLSAISVATLFAVDAFAFISGWYGIKFRWRKFFSVMCVGVYCVIVVGVLHFCLSHEIDLRYSLGWYGNGYLALMLLTPILNAGLDALDREGGLLIAWSLYAVGMVMAWLPMWSGVSGWHGHSLNTLMFMYVTGRVFRSLKFDSRFNTSILICAIIGTTLVNLMWAWCGSMGWPMFIGTRDYNSPFIIVLSVSVVLLIIKMPELRNSSIEKMMSIMATLAPSCFAVYLMHDGIPNRCIERLYCNIESRFYCSIQHEIIVVIITVIMVFGGCVLLDIPRRIFSRIKKQRQYDKRDCGISSSC